MPSILSLDRAQAEQDKLRALLNVAPPSYEDTFMNSDETSGQDADDSLPEGQGVRSWLVESRAGLGEASAEGYGRRQALEFGQRVELRRETSNYGEIILQADGRHITGNAADQAFAIGSFVSARENTGSRITLRNLGLPLTTTTFADSAAGDIYSEITDGLARSYRLSLGSTTVRGMSTRVFGQGLDLRAGYGDRGILAGSPYPGFEKTGGTLGWLGATRRFDDGWFIAGQIERASEVSPYLYGFPGDSVQNRDIDSWATAVGWGKDVLRDGDVRARATVLGSVSYGLGPADSRSGARGVFAEASSLWRGFRHEAGIYAADPGLRFGDYALTSTTKGAYWHVSGARSRLNWSAGLDLDRMPASADGAYAGYHRTGLNGNLQYVISGNTSTGASLNVANTQQVASGEPGGRAGSVYASAYFQTRFARMQTSRFNLVLRRNELVVLGGGTATGQELQWEQAWTGGRYEIRAPELSTTLGYARDQSDGADRTYPTAGVQFRYWTEDGTALSGNLRYTSQSGGLYTSRGLSGTISAERDVGSGWRAGVSANLNQARAAAFQRSFAGPQVYRSNEKTLYVYLRWEGSSGSAYQPAGVRSAAAGTGSVSGRVFMDANQDGVQQLGEAGIENVEVVLDSRYRTVTGKDGQFEFAIVNTGRHRLSLTPETVPLPWGPAPDASTEIDVPLRGHASAFVPVTRVGQ